MVDSAGVTRGTSLKWRCEPSIGQASAPAETNWMCLRSATEGCDFGRTWNVTACFAYLLPKG
jgi:hypothetical protein